MSDEPDTLGMGDLEAGVVFGFPFFRRDTPLLITPYFATHFLENAAALDIPSTPGHPSTACGPAPPHVLGRLQVLG
jgi:hypothetical protein